MEHLRKAVLAAAVAGALAPPWAAIAQALPEEVRSAGVTLAAWSGVQLAVKRSAAEKHVSEQALASVCARMGIELARGHRFDMNRMIALISGRASELEALNAKLELETQQNDPAAGGLLKQARSAIDAGDLDGAEHFLREAGLAARSAVEDAQRQEAEITATDAQVKALQFDYLGAAATYAQAAGELPPGDSHDRWTYALRQADMLEQRGELFEEPQALNNAVGVYRDTALPLVDRSADPLDWAKTEIPLGWALEVTGERGDDAALHEAVAVERGALEAVTREQDPAVWANAQNDLGVALEMLGYQGDDAALRQAIVADRAALTVRIRKSDPTHWADTENNLGNALFVLGEHGDDAALRQAIAAYRAELEVDTRPRSPNNWATDQTNLGNALEVLGRRSNDTAALNDAAAAYRNALQVWTRDQDPFRWATAENGLGTGLADLGERGDAAALHDAVATFRSALEVRTRARDPANWAMTQNNLGEALETLGERGDGAALRAAVAAERAALEVFTRDRDPAHWAMVQYNLGNAFEASALRGDAAALGDAIAAYREALEVWTPAAFPPKAKEASDGLARAQALMAKRGRPPP
ncbi:MAG TPA: hypothetical protein VGS12_05470 [Caulobacteraceae bacterium]|nr:hypothetical protein [Caulobacteraceae bacterium]